MNTIYIIRDSKEFASKFFRSKEEALPSLINHANSKLQEKFGLIKEYCYTDENSNIISYATLNITPENVDDIAIEFKMHMETDLIEYNLQS